jgi:hypothetical protein
MEDSHTHAILAIVFARHILITWNRFRDIEADGFGITIQHRRTLRISIRNNYFYDNIIHVKIVGKNTTNKISHNTFDTMADPEPFYLADSPQRMAAIPAPGQPRVTIAMPVRKMIPRRNCGTGVWISPGLPRLTRNAA